MNGSIGRRARAFIVWLIVAAGAAAAMWLAEQRAEAIVGPASIIDGDSLRVAGVEIRLFGIDAPELAQICTRAGRPWACGREAAEALRAAAADREVTCRPRDQDRYGRTVAVCHAGGVDLGAAMIKGGLAVAYGAYEADEREARDARRGLWSSTFDPPALWRARHPRRPH
ncbi:MAG: thermonuclease family protein [Variibacter sp.]|nr:thermonuclease family protein [Variibacter sp.]